MNEVFKDVVGSEGVYQISNKGNFRRHPDKPRKANYPKQINKLGYQYISISLKGKKTNKTEKITEVINELFIPLGLESRYFYEYHFGVIGVDETMIIGNTAVY